MAINLLPIELAPKGSAIKIATYLRTIVTIFVVLLLLLIVLIAALLGINYFQLRSLSSSTEVLKAKVSSLEIVEQKFFLVKDRLKYAQEISNGTSGQENLQKMSNMFATLPSDILLTQVYVGIDRFTISINTLNSESLVSFMSGIISNPDFSKINLLSFTFSSGSGYEASLEFYP